MLQSDNNNKFIIKSTRPPMAFFMPMAWKLCIDAIKAAGKKRNFLCSPTSLNLALSMMALAAKGNTLDQILTALESDDSDDVIHKASVLITGLSTMDDDDNRHGDCLAIANGLWLADRFTFKSSYQQNLSTVFHAESKAVDFLNKSEEVRQEINLWVEKATKGLIKDLIPEQTLEPTCKLVSVNAVCFKRRWDVPFDADRTCDKDFHLLDDDDKGGRKTVKVPFMVPDFRCNSSLAYGFFQDFKVLRVPYAGGSNARKFSFYIFLPHARDGLEGLINASRSDPKLIQHHCDFLSITEVQNTWIPKLKFSYGFEAKEVMESLGLTGMFEPMAGELTEMIEGSGGDLLFVNRVLHKCCIEVDEEGTKAAAVTESDEEMGFSMYDPPEPPSFVADHPFLFFIREDISKIVLFTGVVLNPILND